jgi:hypothetical protein
MVKKKKRNYPMKHIIVLVIFFTVLLFLNLFYTSHDFESTKEGTFMGWIQNSEITDDKIVLLNSAKIPDMSLVYYPKEQRLVGGTPKLEANNIVLFDGNLHQVGYTFKRDDKQSLFYDGKIVRESDFEYRGDFFTGQVIGSEVFFVSSVFERYTLS